jgi:hypothetical protein
MEVKCAEILFMNVICGYKLYTYEGKRKNALFDFARPQIGVFGSVSLGPGCAILLFFSTCPTEVTKLPGTSMTG